MNISTEIPSVYRILSEKFGVKWSDNILITVGDTIHTKNPDLVRPDLLVHEKCHEIQQRTNPRWWDEYLSNDSFRMRQEVEAYQAQAIFVKRRIKDRNHRYKILRSMAQDLATLYGFVMTTDHALSLITPPWYKGVV